jgi:hypothetical protein
MIMEILEDEYSEEDYEPSESDEEQLNLYGRIEKPNQNEGSTFPKKERIKRTGLVGLNMTRNYGRKSGWGVREGIRELIQNLCLSNKKFTNWIVQTMSVKIQMVPYEWWIGYSRKRIMIKFIHSSHTLKVQSLNRTIKQVYIIEKWHWVILLFVRTPLQLY